MSIRIRRVVCPVTLVLAEASGMETPRQAPRAPVPEVSQSRAGQAAAGTEVGASASGLERTLRRRELPPPRHDASFIPAGARPLTASGTTPLRPLAGASLGLSLPTGPGERGEDRGSPMPLAPAMLGALVSRRTEQSVRTLGASRQLFEEWAGARQQPLVLAQTRRSAGRDSLSSVETMGPEAIQRLASGGGGMGAPLADDHRQEMETIVGGEFRDTRIHTGDAAATTAAAIGADAFTIGRDVFFGQGKYEPTSVQGRALLAHELVHVRQQASGGVNRLLTYGGEADAAEAEARSVEQAVLSVGQSPSGGLTIGNYVRNYHTTSELPPDAVSRLDAISLQALEACRLLLGSELSRVQLETIESLEVELSLDLGALTDEQAANIWGQALAEQIRSGTRSA